MHVGTLLKDKAKLVGQNVYSAGVRHATYRDARGVAHSYFFSWEHSPTRNLEVDWLDSRNICRRHCMDAVSLETPQENEFVKQRLVRGKPNSNVVVQSLYSHM